MIMSILITRSNLASQGHHILYKGCETDARCTGLNPEKNSGYAFILSNFYNRAFQHFALSPDPQFTRPCQTSECFVVFREFRQLMTFEVNHDTRPFIQLGPSYALGQKIDDAFQPDN